MVEFVYQFQGFCQYRTQLHIRNPEDIKNLAANVTAWSYPQVHNILHSLIRDSGIRNKTVGKVHADVSVKSQFGYFAAIELARLECLAGDHVSSLRAISTIDIFDNTELLETLPTCHINLYYHTGISQMLLRRFTDAIDTFNNVILYISRILKPGVSSIRSNIATTLNRILDKILALTAICSSLSPGHRVDDQVREMVQGKYKDKIYKLADGDIKTYLELFEAACPKFIYVGIPDYGTQMNYNQEMYLRQVQVFMTEVEQNAAALKLRSYLRLYAAIEVDKLARFNDLSDSEFASKLISFQHKACQIESSIHGSKPVYTSDVNYFVKDGNIVIESSGSRHDKEKAFEKYFISGIRKHVEIYGDLQRAVSSSGLEAD